MKKFKVLLFFLMTALFIGFVSCKDGVLNDPAIISQLPEDDGKDNKDTNNSNNNNNNNENQDDEEIPENLSDCCTITFHSNDGTNKTYVQYFPMNGGTSLSDLYRKLKPCKFTREGYAFEGWAKTPDAENADYVEEALISRLFFVKEGTLSSNPELIKNVDFYAIWTDATVLKIKFQRKYSNEETFEMSVPITDNKATFRLPECSFEPENENSVFACWRSSTYQSIDMYPGETYTFEDEKVRKISIWGVWINKNDTFTRTVTIYNGVDSNSEYITRYYNWSTQDELAIWDCPFDEREDAEFVGWSGSSTAVKADLQPYDRVDTFKEVPSSLYALWSKDITIKYNSNDGTNSEQTQIVKSYKPVMLSNSIFNNGDKRIYGWCKTKKNTEYVYSNDVYPFEEGVYFNSNITLYAIWSSPITLTFKPNGGEQPDITISGYQLFPVECPSEFTRTGYTLIGYSTKEKSSPEIEIEKGIYRPLKNTTYYAVWSKPISITVCAGRTDVSCDDALVEADTCVKYYLPNTTYLSGVLAQNEYKAWNIGSYQDLYKLRAWRVTYSDGTHEDFEYRVNSTDYSSLVLYDGATTVTALWNAPYVITFHANNGTDETKQQVITYDDGQHLAANTFTYEGHVFKGWVENPNGTGWIDHGWTDYNDKGYAHYSSGGSIDLYAAWVEE